MKKTILFFIAFAIVAVQIWAQEGYEDLAPPARKERDVGSYRVDGFFGNGYPGYPGEGRWREGRKKRSLLETDVSGFYGGRLPSGPDYGEVYSRKKRSLVESDVGGFFGNGPYGMPGRGPVVF
uniref:Secreted protein n=1 Tax=Acrobeloides nanus TaxID=290746 RepID=A0A914DBG4_9BILA